MTLEPFSQITRALLDRPFGRADPGDEIERYERAIDTLTDRRDVSIVIPIYNAPASLEACLESLVETGTQAEVILVDDRSPNPRVNEVCERFLETWPQVTLVRNEHNLGFVSSVNAGLRASSPDNDIVLLNSDTRVTGGWLEKMGTAARMAPNVASVSPLSNAAGIFSLPVVHSDNPLPPGWSAELCNRILEEVSWREYERLPTTSGFCLYIRREAIDAVGLFDDLLLRRGYGEENDFCARCASAGFIHLMDDATFVFHEREASFKGTKAELKRRNTRVLKALHPEHIAGQRSWEERTRLDELRQGYEPVQRKLAKLPAEQVHAALGPLTTTLVIARHNDDAPPAEWTGARRTLVVRLGVTAELEVFGLGRAPLGPARDAPLGLLSWLANRFGARSLRVVSDALEPAQADRLRAALPLLNSADRAPAAAL
jgi:GT2 family glycosyltransferase